MAGRIRVDRMVNASRPLEVPLVTTTTTLQKETCNLDAPLYSLRISQVTFKKQQHTTGGIPRWSPTLVLVARFSAYVWQSGRDAQFSLTYGRMYLDPKNMLYKNSINMGRQCRLERLKAAQTPQDLAAFKLTTIMNNHQ
jgi:hypothetical protein